MRQGRSGGSAPNRRGFGDHGVPVPSGGKCGRPVGCVAQGHARRVAILRTFWFAHPARPELTKLIPFCSLIVLKPPPLNGPTNVAVQKKIWVRKLSVQGPAQGPAHVLRTSCAVPAQPLRSACALDSACANPAHVPAHRLRTYHCTET